MVLKPTQVLSFPGCTATIDAAANSSAAVRAEDSSLFTWGSNEAGRLGYGMSYAETEEMGLTCKPRAVVGLCGKRVSSMVITKDGGFAFVPSSVDMVEPPCFPISGGSKVVLRGGGFWSSSDCVVKFIPLYSNGEANNNASRSSVGKFIQEKVSETRIVCRLPRFTCSCDVYVEVTMNGKDFTHNCVRAHLYREPLLNKVRPGCCSLNAATSIDIEGSNIFETGFIKIRFQRPGCPSQGWLVPGSFNSRDQILISCLQRDGCGVVTCKSPKIDEGEVFPIQARISVALNGVDFVFVHGPLFVIHNAAVLDLIPDCCPMHSKVDGESIETTLQASRTIHLRGRSFFDSKAMLVRLCLNYCEETHFHACDAHFVNDETIAFEAPSLNELLASYKLDNFTDDSGQQSESLHFKCCFCDVQITLNGTDFLDEILPFVFYDDFGYEEITALSPLLGPSSGGSSIAFQIPLWLASSNNSNKCLRPEYNSVAVRLQQMNKGSSICTKPLIMAAEVSLLATISDAPTIVLTFVTPPMHMEKQCSSDVRGNGYDAIDVGAGGMKEERSTITEVCNSEDNGQSIAPQ
mmetsp:Transcript_4416/g.13063  ORF Transcript_4416/g.13063 Transcript_4416/m.13063 type:complete len:577 (-) Transcript_4416:11-1741(-)